MAIAHTDAPALSDLHRVPQDSVKRKAEDPEAVALVSDDVIAKRQARFKTQEQSAEEQRRQRFMDPDTVKAKERKERFGKWLPQDSGKTSKDDVAAAIGTSLDNSMPAKGRGRGRANSGSAAPKEEKFSAEFTAKAEVGLLLLLCRGASAARGADLVAVNSAGLCTLYIVSCQTQLAALRNCCSVHVVALVYIQLRPAYCMSCKAFIILVLAICWWSNPWVITWS